MPGSLEQPPIVIFTSRWKAALLALSCLALIMLAAYAAKAGYSEGSIGTVIGVVFFGLGIPLALDGVFRPSRLEIGPSGLWLTTPHRAFGLDWNEVENFRSISVKGARMVVFDRTDVSGGRGSLPMNWSISPKALASLLNEARERWWGRPLVRLVD